MKAHEILEGITRHRIMHIENEGPEVLRKINEIEWALQAIAEYLTDLEDHSQ